MLSEVVGFWDAKNSKKEDLCRRGNVTFEVFGITLEEENTFTLSLMPAAFFQTVEQAFRQIQNIVDFSSNVMSILLGEKFVHSGVSSSWLLALFTMAWSLSGCLLSITTEDSCLLVFDCCWWMLSSSSNLV